VLTHTDIIVTITIQGSVVHRRHRLVEIETFLVCIVRDVARVVIGTVENARGCGAS
jgi:hypothetical protein